MGSEQDKGQKPLSRFLKRDGGIPRGDEPDGAIVPLSPEQKKAYPYVIYELESNSPFDQALVLASYEAMTGAQFPIALDLEGSGSDVKAIVKTSAAERNEQSAQSALFLGLTEATRRNLEDLGEDMTPTPETTEYKKQADNMARGLLDGLTSKPGLYNAFSEYYGGLRWHYDQEKFTHELFVYGADFNQDLLQQFLSGSYVRNLAYRCDISYDKLRDTYDATPEELFERFSELDYRQLVDAEFLATSEGQKLFQQYTEICGEILADQYKRGIDRNITNDGKELSKPQLPLSRHPIIEALIVEELSVDRPKPKYNFGPSDLTDTVLNSDSQVAHDALVNAITTRLPREQRSVFDGPDEFEHKQRNILSVLGAYKSASDDDQRRQLLRRDLIGIIDSFTTDGEIATSVREEDILYRVRSRGWSSDGKETESKEVSKTKEIVKNLMVTGLTAPDPEIVARVEDLAAKYVPENGNEITVQDVLSLKRGDIILVLFDALQDVSAGTQPGVFERVGTRVFGDPAIGEKLRGFVEARIQARAIRNNPEVLLALKELRKYHFSIGDQSRDEIKARENFNGLVEAADEIVEEQRKAKNDLVLTLLDGVASTNALASDKEAAELFSGLVKRVEFNEYDIRELPSEYYDLLEIAHHPSLTDRQKNDILWRFQNQFEYINTESAHLLVPVILDMYQVSLGAIEEVSTPTSDTYLGLAAAAHLVGRHGHEMFKSASQEQLETLANYGKAIRSRAERIATGVMLDDGERAVDEEGLQDWQKETLWNMRSVMRELQSVEGYYERYLRMEAVKVYPHVYYPWLLEQMVPFWQKMQWEVDPGNRPAHDIRELYRVFDDHIKNKLVIKDTEEYGEDFDAIGEGHIDTLLKEGYERMIVPHDIQYNSTVWQEGLPFIHRAISNMPTVLLEQIVTKYPNSKFADYLNKEHARSNKEGR